MGCLAGGVGAAAATGLVPRAGGRGGAGDMRLSSCCTEGSTGGVDGHRGGGGGGGSEKPEGEYCRDSFSCGSGGGSD